MKTIAENNNDTYYRWDSEQFYVYSLPVTFLDGYLKLPDGIDITKCLR